MAKLGYVGANQPLLEAVERLTGLSRNDIRTVNISLSGDDLPKVEVILTLDASKNVDFVAVLDAIRAGGAQVTFDHLCGDECMWAEHTHARFRVETQPAEPDVQRQCEATIKEDSGASHACARVVGHGSSEGKLHQCSCDFLWADEPTEPPSTHKSAITREHYTYDPPIEELR